MGKAEPSKKTVSKKNGLKGSMVSWPREEIAETMKSVIASRKGIHVIAYGENWGVLREGAKRLSKIHSNKQTAVAYAKRLAQKDADAEVIIHKKDGSPQEYFQSNK